MTRSLARDPRVVRALAREDETALAQIAAMNNGISFGRGGRGAAAPRSVVVRDVEVRDDGRTVGYVAGSLRIDRPFVGRIERMVRPEPPDRIVFAIGGRALGTTGSRVAELPAEGAGSDGGGFRVAAVPLLRDRPDVRAVATTPLAPIDAEAGERRRRVLLAAGVTGLTLLLAAAAVVQWWKRRTRTARRANIELDRRRVREALSLVGEALAATHDPDALLPVIAQTAMEAAGATEARLLRGETEVLRAGRRSSSRSPVVLQLGADEDGTPLRLLLYSPGGRLPVDAQELAEWFVSQASIAIENARLHRIVQRQAVTDDLTSLANRRRFVEALEDELSRAQRFDTDLAVVIADLDDFKSVNDRFGHEFGNDVLRAFGEVMRASLRDIDVAARLGGEEFAVLLPQTDLDGGIALADRLREEVAAATLTAPDGSPLHVTASFGVAAFPPTPSVDDLLRVADSALYRAKAMGKNRVVAA